MHSWIFRNRARLETIYGRPGRGRPLLEPPPALPRTGRTGGRGRPGGAPADPRLVVYQLVPLPRREKAA